MRHSLSVCTQNLLFGPENLPTGKRSLCPALCLELSFSILALIGHMSGFVQSTVGNVYMYWYDCILFPFEAGLCPGIDFILPWISDEHRKNSHWQFVGMSFHNDILREDVIRQRCLIKSICFMGLDFIETMSKAIKHIFIQLFVKIFGLFFYFFAY